MTDSDRLYQITSLTRDALNHLEKGGSEIQYWLRKIEKVAHDGCGRARAIEKYFVAVAMLLCFGFAILSSIGVLGFLFKGHIFKSILCGIAAAFLFPAAPMLGSHLENY